MKLDRFDLTELQGFRTTQRLAYACVQAVEAQLRPGMTEREACTLMKEYLVSRGVSQMFHEPFAWFGDRTAFRDIRRDQDFLPSDRKLEKGMAVILDIAPIREGYTADIGYATSYGDNEEMEQLQKVLI